MIYNSTGEATPGFHILGHSATPSYLLDAPLPALFDAGFSCLGPAYAKDARRVLGPDRDPAYLFLTHSHFDHCGAAAHLRKSFPGLTIAASERTGEIMRRPSALQLIARLNREARKAVRLWEPSLDSEVEFEPFEPSCILVDGDVVDLGGDLSVQVLATPGHTWDFLSYFIVEKGILIASEAVGCADATGYVVTEFLVDYEAYEASLIRLAGLNPRVLCQGHRLVYLDEDVQVYLQKSLEAAREYKSWVEDLLHKERGDIARVMAKVKASEYDPRPWPKQPEPAYLLNMQARVRHLAKRLGYLDEN